jgi:hypothetical protein
MAMQQDGATERHGQPMDEDAEPRRTSVPAVFYGGDLPQAPVPPAYYRDDTPPDPPRGDPHWREFPFFESMRSTHLVIAGIVVCVCLATVVHLALLLFL